MPRQIIPLKMIMNMNPDGTLKDGIIQYQIREIDGSTDARKYHSIAIEGALDSGNVVNLNPIMRKILKHAEKSEKIS